MYKVRTLTYQKARDKWGTFNQTVAAIEELSELNVELAKLLTGKRDERNGEDLFKLVDELADATIMIEQMCYNYKVYPCVQSRMKKKLEKLDAKLNKIDETNSSAKKMEGKNE